MRSFLIICLLHFLPFISYSNNENIFDFSELDQTIIKKNQYEQQKVAQIEHLKTSLFQSGSFSLNEHVIIYDRLHQAYFTFNYDSAMVYALKMMETARQIKDPVFLSKAKLSLSSTLLASGVFSEAKDTLSTISLTSFSDSLKVEFYYDFSRLYFDMVDYYQKSYYVEMYVQRGLQYLDSAIQLTQKGSQKYYSLNGLKLVRTFAYTDALSNYDSLFVRYQPTGRQLAIDASTFGFVLEQNGRLEEGINWLIKAAIEDIRLANKENVALLNLANKLYEQGNIEKASEYLNVALEDAKTYGALQRKFQISQIQPIVEAAKLQITEQQKVRIKRYASMVTLLSLLIVIILFVLYRQFQKVKAARDVINQSNEALKTTNQKLREVNLIKEEYIGQFFKTNSDLIDKLEGFRQTVENKVMTRKIDELNGILKKQNIKEEREAMYRTFDAVFLNIFPDFVAKFNALFEEDDRIELKSSEQMNTDLRIFALIRLGISDTEKIAHILDYSVNTINTYKTKIKNRSTLTNEDFEKEILKIQSI
ncbi:MAG: DUF6377 domain-containing protein [Prolixibacteraceae bacterium]